MSIEHIQCIPNVLPHTIQHAKRVEKGDDEIPQTVSTAGKENQQNISHDRAIVFLSLSVLRIYFVSFGVFFSLYNAVDQTE